ncbi:sphingomyelin phosphodiesterase-like isoform X1 [Thrips palmi]|uniref:Sphingomyelin phosphodiesterase n=1 Tax=Thrips palmi TaxID=161013 RepID=A0A6P9A624_THRPL|nr:sphingomyelin phosphodiesterase-like isoform X1 [Thrips palmi]
MEIGTRAGVLGQAAQAVGNAFIGKGKCFICVVATGLIQKKVKDGATDEDVANTLTEQCKLYRVQEPAVCDGVIRLFAPEVVYIINNTNLTPNEICSYAFTDDCGDDFDRKHDWTVELPPGPKPPVEPEREPKAGAPRLKLLQLSDTHVDPHYKEGSLADCELPLCCRGTSGPANGKRLAGKWGDYGRCDAPVALLENTLQHIAKEHPDLDGILWTGDLQPHDIWNQTREESLSILRLTTDMILRAFPGVPVFPALGNHEAVPVNSFSPSTVTGRLSMSWLYDEVATQWAHWLPANQSGLVRRGAFYSVLFKPGLRVVSINTNFCNDKNWWLLLNSDDPDQELHWLVEELQKAERAGEKVLVVGHIPPGTPECRSVWSRNFDEILLRYENTVSGLFFGHNHWDEFQLFFDRAVPDKLRPYAVAYVSPSVTPYEKPNPAYRIYYVDGEHPDTTYSVVDHDTWTMDLKAANREGTPEWMRLYSAAKAYNLPSLTPSSWTRLVRDMASNDALFDEFYKNYYRDSAERPACDNQCRRKILCQQLQGRSRDTTPCQLFLPLEVSGKDVPDLKETEVVSPTTQKPQLPMASSPPPSSSSSSTNPTAAIVFMLLALISACGVHL